MLLFAVVSVFVYHNSTQMLQSIFWHFPLFTFCCLHLDNVRRKYIILMWILYIFVAIVVSFRYQSKEWNDKDLNTKHTKRIRSKDSIWWYSHKQTALYTQVDLFRDVETFINSLSTPTNTIIHQPHFLPTKVFVVVLFNSHLIASFGRYQVTVVVVVVLAEILRIFSMFSCTAPPI